MTSIRLSLFHRERFFSFLTTDLNSNSKRAETILTRVRVLVPSPTGYIQASRALMIASIVFGSFGIVATLSGMQCSKIGGENYLLKGRIAAIGGVFFLLQGNGAGTHVFRTSGKGGEEPVCKTKHLERWITYPCRQCQFYRS